MFADEESPVHKSVYVSIAGALLSPARGREQIVQMETSHEKTVSQHVWAYGISFLYSS